MIILSIICFILYGIFNAISDTILFHYDTSRLNTKFGKNKWWNPNISHLNKYKNDKKIDGPKYFGSTTFFVVFTDALHLFRALKIMFLVLSVYFSITLISMTLCLIGAKIIFELLFRILNYDKIFNI